MDRVALVSEYASLFVHSWRQYAVQQRDGRYWRVAEPLTLSLISAHLAGLVTLGTYLLDEQADCSFAVFDADSEDGLDRLGVLAGELAQQGIPTIVEASRRGGHLWLHLVEPVPASVVRAWLLPYAQVFGVELYPKQDRLAPDGSGSLLRVPLGIHRRSRGWYPFLHWSPYGVLAPVADTIMACCEWVVEHVERVRPPDAAWAVLENGSQGSPHVTTLVEQGESGPIRAWCRSQEVVEVIGRYVALNRRGVGSCPFKHHHDRGDRRPSFQVFADSDQCWYCYTWGRGGDLFDFLCLYHNLTPQEGWLRLQHGTLG